MLCSAPIGPPGVPNGTIPPGSGGGGNIPGGGQGGGQGRGGEGFGSGKIRMGLFIDGLGGGNTNRPGGSGSSFSSDSRILAARFLRSASVAARSARFFLSVSESWLIPSRSACVFLSDCLIS